MRHMYRTFSMGLGSAVVTAAATLAFSVAPAAAAETIPTPAESIIAPSPSQPETPSPTAPPASPTEEPTTNGQVQVPASPPSVRVERARPELAVTGSTVTPVIIAGAALLIAGVGLVVLSKRRPYHVKL